MNSIASPNANIQSREKRWEKVGAISNLVIAIVSVFSLTGIIFGRSGNVPEWFYWLPPAIIVVWVFAIAWKKTKELTGVFHKDLVARKKGVQLQRLAREFQNLTGRNQRDAVTIALSHLSNTEGWRGIELMNGAFFDFFEYTLVYFVRRIDRGIKDFSEFVTLYDELSAIISSYGRVYFEETFNRIRLNKNGTLRPDEKGELELAREGYASFVRKLENFSNECIQDFHNGFSRRYYSIPKPL